MPPCPVCNTELDEKSLASGQCSRCGHRPSKSGMKSAAGSGAPRATSSFETMSVSELAMQQAASAAEQATAPSKRPPDKGRSMSIAPRKLSAANVAMVTAAWGAVSSDATPRTSLKFDSQSSSASMGSSLVVNQRAMRDVQHVAQGAPGADYELLEVIGKGGMGVVYSARQASVDRIVAVKMIRPKAAADQQRREKFLSEAVVTGDLDHPNIVPIYELGSNEENALFYSMKRVQGTPWGDCIAEKSLAENLEILMKVSDAVAFAHSNGVIHRDLKPENIMLGDFGEVLVMDWGLALATSAFRHADFVSTTENMGGTPAYMAPEMVTGPFESIGPASDIYLLGALLYEVVSGLRPHHGETAQACLMAAARNEIQLCEQTGELIDIAYRALSTEPADRHASVQEFQTAIREYHSHTESAALSTRADQELAQAKKTGDYQSFAHAVFGFEEAHALWTGNTRARAGISEARLAYASCAEQKGDFELGVSLLEADDPTHAPLRAALLAAQREREARQKWLTRFKRIAAAMVMIVFGVITASLVVVSRAKNQEAAAKEQAIHEKNAADVARNAAEIARQNETKEKDRAVNAENNARAEERAARTAEKLAQAAERETATARDEERKQKEIAIEAEAKAKAEEQNALRAKQREEYSAYMARIGMAAAKVDENAFDAAEGLLAACQPPDRADNLRNWEWGYLHRLCGQGIKYEAQGTIASVAFARNGGWFVTAGEDGQAHLFNVGSSHQRAAISHGDYIHAVAVSPDGRLVATAGGDGLVRLSNADDGKFVRTLAGHTDRVLGVAFSPVDGRWLLTCSRDKTARLWDTATGKELAGSPLVGHSWWVWSAAFSPDERHLATAGQDGKVIIWSFDPAGSQKIEQQKVFLGHDGPVFAVAFSPDGKQVVSAGYDKRVLAWIPEKIQDIALKQLVADVPMVPQESRSFEGHSAPVRAVSFSADGHYVLSGGDDNTLRIWDIRSGKQHALLRGHSRPIQSCAFSPRGGLVLSGGQEGQIKLWKILADSRAVAPEGRVLEGHEDAILSATFSRDGRRIATASRDHTARIYDARSGQSLCQLKEGHEFLASRAMFFNRGRRLLTASGDNTMRIWDAATGLEQSSLEGTGRAAAVAVSHDSKWILTGRTETNTRRGPADGTEGDDASQPRITLWDLDAEAKLPQPHVFSKGQFGIGHRSIVTAVAISPDRRWLFSGDEAGTGKLWDAVEGTEFHTLKGHTAAITDAAFSPDSRRLFTSSNDGTVAHWDVTSGKELPLVFSHADPERRHAYDAPITAMALSPDGRQLLSLSEGSQGTTRESVIRLWDVGQGKLVHELYRGPENITSVAFADSAREAVAASSPRSSEITAEKEIASAVRRWDLATGREIHGPEGKPFLDFKGSPEVIWAALDVPGGARVLTIGGKGAAIWDPNNPRQPDLVFKPHTGVTSASFSPDGRFVVTGSSDHRAKIWNAETGRGELQLPPEHSKPITSAAYSPTDANLLLTASSDGTARLWQLPTRRVLRVFKHDPSQTRTVSVRCAIFSPDGNHILTAGADRAVRIWNAGTGQLVGTITLDASALAAAYSVDGRRILLGLSSGKAILFDAASRRPLVRYSGHTGAINSVALSPDGRRALTGSNDRSAKIWDTDREHSGAASGQASATAAASIDVKDGTDILTLKHHDQAVTSVAFSPDGYSVLTAGLDGTAVVWLADNWDEKPAPP